jgi:osmotically-inducible protein OsmY
MRDRDREWGGPPRGRFDRDDDDRWMSDEDRGWGGGQRGDEGRWREGQQGQNRGYSGQQSRGGERDWQRGGGWGERNEGFGREDMAWGGGATTAGYGASRRDYGFGGERGYGGGQSYSGGQYGGRQSIYGGGGVRGGFYGGGERFDLREDRGRGDDRGLLERAGDWLQRKLAGKPPKGYRRSDERIREDVCDLLMRRPEIDASDVDVQVKDGEVTLTGTVTERHMKRVIEDIAEDVLGVDDVHNQIKVRRAEMGTTTGASNGDRDRITTTGRGEKSTRPTT